MLPIKKLGTVPKGNPQKDEFYDYAMLQLPLDCGSVFKKYKNMWFDVTHTALICYDDNGIPYLAVTKSDKEDQVFGVTTHGNSNKTEVQDQSEPTG